jgi:hypothetical protein
LSYSQNNRWGQTHCRRRSNVCIPHN